MTAHAGRFIASVRVVERVFCAGRFVIRATDPRWVEHAVVGTVFNTTAYPPDAEPGAAADRP